ncbi:hypothetical protein CYMTET_17636 [Cymbomonas tetramitiformis]|uniref:Uncharacterized protein n=1 Tax=Cymbomonas tetramitiformis TaxID=36881 RepID=A0AAE0G9X6_9CHLO|nr:hypothetical protein CYMTET_17636 [Cymbomonas tetramitiformis]
MFSDAGISPQLASAKPQTGDELDWIAEYQSPQAAARRTSSPSSGSESPDMIVDPVDLSQDIDKVIDMNQKQETTEKEVPEKTASKTRTAAAEMPLMLPDKVTRNKVLVELSGDQEATDLEGDVGSVGRFNMLGKEMQLDLKGLIYSAQIVPSNTFLVVSVGDSKGEKPTAKVEAIMNDFMQLKEVDNQDLVQDNEADWESQPESSGDEGGNNRSAKRKRKEDNKKQSAEGDTGGASAVVRDRENADKGKGKSKATKSSRGGRGGKARGGGARKSAPRKPPAKK